MRQRRLVPPPPVVRRGTDRRKYVAGTTRHRRLPYLPQLRMQSAITPTRMRTHHPPHAVAPPVPARGTPRVAGLGERPTSIAEPRRAPSLKKTVRDRPSRRERPPTGHAHRVPLGGRERGAAPDGTQPDSTQCVRLRVAGVGDRSRAPARRHAGGKRTSPGRGLARASAPSAVQTNLYGRFVRRTAAPKRGGFQMRLVREKETGGRTGRRHTGHANRVRLGAVRYESTATLSPPKRRFIQPHQMAAGTMIRYGNGDRNAAQRAAAAAPWHWPGTDQAAALDAVRSGREPLHDHRRSSSACTGSARCATRSS